MFLAGSSRIGGMDYLTGDPSFWTHMPEKVVAASGIHPRHGDQLLDPWQAGSRRGRPVDHLHSQLQARTVC